MNILKKKKWEADKYFVLTNNCQKFGAEVIKFLKAIRKYEHDKIRILEKVILPSCIISALWSNEKLSLGNSLGRIPIFGYFHDLYTVIKNNDEISEHFNKYNK